MHKYAHIGERVAAWWVLAKERPTDLFGAMFYDIRAEARTNKEKMEDAAVKEITAIVTADLKKAGYKITNLSIVLGRYRGSGYVTSARIDIAGLTQPLSERLVSYLQTKYSPKYKFKGIAEDGIATFNVR